MNRHLNEFTTCQMIYIKLLAQLGYIDETSRACCSSATAVALRHVSSSLLIQTEQKQDSDCAFILGR